MPTQDMDALLTAVEAATAFHTSIAVILMWRNRGTLTPIRKDWRGRHLYRWGDLLDAERGARQTRARIGLPPRALQATPYERCRG
ncbi:MAG: hypothetical protein V4510_12080 [bacterium]